MTNPIAKAIEIGQTALVKWDHDLGFSEYDEVTADEATFITLFSPQLAIAALELALVAGCNFKQCTCNDGNFMSCKISQKKDELISLLTAKLGDSRNPSP